MSIRRWICFALFAGTTLCGQAMAAGRNQDGAPAPVVVESAPYDVHQTVPGASGTPVHSTQGTVVSDAPMGCSSCGDYIGPDSCGGGCGGSCDGGCGTGYGYGYGSDCGCCGNGLGMGGGMDGCCPTDWQVSAGVTWLRRNSPSAQPLLYDYLGQSVFDAQDLSTGYQAGSYVQLCKSNILGSCTGLQVGFFGIDSWNKNAYVPQDPNGNYTLVADSQGGPQVYNAYFNYGTDLYSVEANLTRCVTQDITFLAGFRWVELGDVYQAWGTDDLATGYAHTVNTNNHLFGFQIGMCANLLQVTDRFSVQGFGKAGIFGNSHDFSSTYDNPYNLGYLSAGSRGNNAAFVGNVGLGGTYRMSCNLSLNAGYQVFWVDGVALATNQFDNVDLNNYSAYGANRDSLYFHGGYAGLTFAF